ncbi:MAG: hypothetical protein AAGM33_00940 [Pseudomonadota bacterium]
MKLARPKSIIWFERLFWISVFASFVSDLDTEGSLFELLLIELIAIGLMFLVWDMIARRANNVFKWIYSVLAVVGLGIYTLAVSAHALGMEILGGLLLEMTGPELVAGGVANILSFSAATCLFLKPSRIWFQSGGRAVQNSDKLSDVFE